MQRFLDILCTIASPATFVREESAGYRHRTAATMDSTENFEYSQFEIKGKDKFQKNSTLTSDEDTYFDVPRCGIFVNECDDKVVKQPPRTSSPIASNSQHGPNGRPSNALQCGCCVRKNAAIAYCNECDAFLCFQCDLAHKQMRCFEQHQICALKNRCQPSESAEAASNTSTAARTNCQHHPIAPLRYYCWKCRECICSICAANGHADEPFSTIEDAEQSVRASIVEIMQRSNVELTNLIEVSKYLLMRSEQLTEEAKVIRNSIDVTYAVILDALDNIRNNAHNKLDHFLAEAHDDTARAIDRIDALKALQKMARNIPHHADLEDLLAMEKKIALELAKVGDGYLKDRTAMLIRFNAKTEDIPELVNEMFGELQIVPSTMKWPQHLSTDCILAGKQQWSKSSCEPSDAPQSSTHSVHMMTDEGSGGFVPNIGTPPEADSGTLSIAPRLTSNTFSHVCTEDSPSLFGRRCCADISELFLHSL